MFWTRFNVVIAVLSFGVIWGFCFAMPMAAVAQDGDGDGIPDADEASYGTSAVDADTDDDGLTDGQEVGLVAGPPTMVRLGISADNSYDALFIDGTSVGTLKFRASLWTYPDYYEANLTEGNHVIAARANNPSGAGGIMMVLQQSGEEVVAVTGPSLPKYTMGNPEGDSTWNELGFDDSSWGTNSDCGLGPWGTLSGFSFARWGLKEGAHYTWTAPGCNGTGQAWIRWTVNVQGCVDTDPTVADTDGDGLLDGQECGLTVADVGIDTALGVFVADADPFTTTSPADADSDDDGLVDGDEDSNQDGAQGASETDPTWWDTDGDYAPDGMEVGNQNAASSGTSAGGIPYLGTDLLNVGHWIADHKTHIVDADPTCTTDPTNEDSDGDGVGDGYEEKQEIHSDQLGTMDGAFTGTVGGTGTSGGMETDPCNPDTDGDGLSDGVEDPNAWYTPGVDTDPADSDTDDGGVNDGHEVNVMGTDPHSGGDDVECFLAVHCTDNNDCTQDSCIAQSCSYSGESVGTSCSLGTGTGVCNGTSGMPANTCRACVDDNVHPSVDTGCSSGTPVCDPSAGGGEGACVECLLDTDCPMGDVCNMSNLCETPMGGSMDGGMADSGSGDSGMVDSGTTDSGTTDSGTADSGTGDSGGGDGGAGDGGTADSGSTGAGADASTPDAAVADAGSLGEDGGAAQLDASVMDNTIHNLHEIPCEPVLFACSATAVGREPGPQLLGLLSILGFALLRRRRRRD